MVVAGRVPGFASRTRAWTPVNVTIDCFSMVQSLRHRAGLWLESTVTLSDHGARSVALPAISAGIFGYPRHEACAVIARTASDWVGRNPEMLDEVRLVGWDDSTTADFAAGLEGRQ